MAFRYFIVVFALVAAAEAQPPIKALASATAPAVAKVAGAISAALSTAPAPGPSGAAAAANMFATLTATSATFTNKTTLVLKGVSPVVAHLTTAPMPHAGTWNISAFTGKAMFVDGVWLGAPDATLIAVDANMTKLSAMLGYLDSPLYDNKTGTLTLTTRLLPLGDMPDLVNGVTNAAALGLGPKLVDALPTGNLTDVAIFIDLALKKQNIPKIEATTKSGVAAYNFDLAYDPSYRTNVANNVEANDLEYRTNYRSNYRSDYRSN